MDMVISVTFQVTDVVRQPSIFTVVRFSLEFKST